MHIIIGIITYKRPESLAHTLNSLSKIKLPASMQVELLVVDNDSGKSAKPVVDAKAATLPFAVRYEVEEQRGIPQARNKVLRLAKDADYIAFIDDDDTVDSNWLAALYETAQRFDADVVKGKIQYSFPANTSHLAGLDIFASPSVATGTSLDTAWTNNVLFSSCITKNSGLIFDTAFTGSGGSDNHFFRCAKKTGAKIVMCQESIVYTAVPVERTRLGWLALRHLRVGATMTLSEIKCEGYKPAVTKVLSSLQDSGAYFARLLPGMWHDKKRAIHPLMVLCFMAGRAAGLLHISPQEYKP